MAVAPFENAHWKAAIDAHRRYGIGRHPAALNFGDCLSGATAKLAGQPLLSTGKGLAKTEPRDRVAAAEGSHKNSTLC